MTDYRFLAKRTDAFIELLSDSLIGWNTCFTVKETDDPFVYSIKVRDLYWNREISFGLNIRFWMIRGFDANGKVVFKFRCYDVEEIYYGGEYKQFDPYTACYYTNKLIPIYLKHRTCLDYEELSKYLNGYERLKGKRGAVGTAIHISYLEIFDKPKELNEFYKVGAKEEYEHIMSIDETQAKPYIDEFYKLTKAPQSFCYVEIGEWEE